MRHKHLVAFPEDDSVSIPEPSEESEKEIQNDYFAGETNEE